MGKKRRNTPAMYQSRAAAEPSASFSAKKRGDGDGGGGGGGGDDDDATYDEVDRYHNRREEEQFLRFGEDGGSDDGGEEEEADDGITQGREGVFDLGVGAGSSDESSESSSDDDDDDAGAASSSSEEADVVSSSEDGSDMEAEGGKTDVLDWGSRKAAYYNGDTADLEIGQDEEDAELEEEAGREVVRARLEGMDEGDFLLDDEEDEEQSGEDEEDSGDDESKLGAVTAKSKKREKAEKDSETSDEVIETIRLAQSDSQRRRKLSKSERVGLVRKSHPEFMPLIAHFRDGTISELAKGTNVLCDALLEDEENAEAVGATPSGLRYLVTKAMLQTSTALNVCQYLLLKAESAAATSSTAPGGDDDGNAMIVAGLVEGSPDEDDVRNHPVISRLNQLNDLAEKLNAEVAGRVPAMKEQVDSLVKAAALMKEEGGGVTLSDEVESGGEGEGDTESSDINEESAIGTKQSMVASRDDESEEDSSSEEEDVISRRVVTEVKYAVRPQDISPSGGEKASKSSRKRRPAPLTSDFGDEDGVGDAANAAPGGALASTLNAITQRTDAKKKKGKMTMAPEEEDDEDDERFMRGLEMMNAEMGRSESDGEGSRGGEDDVDDELDDGLDDDDFYNKIKKKSKAKKDFKKGLYAVAPKYPVVEEEVDGERAISRAIMKNRGLVAHKSKLNRNPRVKKREQYRKAIIRRKGAIREVRTDEGHKYGGEATGIKSGLSRSRKLGVR